jgi:hypothetical protein
LPRGTVTKVCTFFWNDAHEHVAIGELKVQYTSFAKPLYTGFSIHEYLQGNLCYIPAPTRNQATLDRPVRFIGETVTHSEPTNCMSAKLNGRMPACVVLKRLTIFVDMEMRNWGLEEGLRFKRRRGEKRSQSVSSSLPVTYRSIGPTFSTSVVFSISDMYAEYTSSLPHLIKLVTNTILQPHTIAHPALTTSVLPSTTTTAPAIPSSTNANEIIHFSVHGESIMIGLAATVAVLYFCRYLWRAAGRRRRREIRKEGM